jgi:hypothetical protein
MQIVNGQKNGIQICNTHRKERPRFQYNQIQSYDNVCIVAHTMQYIACNLQYLDPSSYIYLYIFVSSQSRLYTCNTDICSQDSARQDNERVNRDPPLEPLTARHEAYLRQNIFGIFQNTY